MDTREFIVARREIQECLKTGRERPLQKKDAPFQNSWPASKWFWPTLLAAGFERTVPRLAACLGLGWLVPKIFHVVKGGCYVLK